MNKAVQKQLIVLLSCCAIGSSFVANSKELLMLPSANVENSLVRYSLTGLNNQNSDLNRDTEINATSANLGLLTNFQTKKIQLTANVESEFIARQSISGDDAEDADAFLQFDGVGNVKLWQDKLLLSGKLSRSQQIETQTVNVGNKLIGGSNWFDVNSGRIALDFNSRLTNKASIRATVEASKVQADPEQSKLIQNSQRINTETTSVSTQIFGLNPRSLFSWQLNAQLAETQRNSFADIRSGNFDLSGSLPLASNWAINSSASQSISQLTGNSALSNRLDYSQVGLGIKWLSAKGSEVSVNVYNSSSQRNSNEVYLGGTLHLNLSKFSELTYKKEKNALGQADSLTLLLQGKRFTVSSNYANSININTTQSLAQAEAELFACPVGANDISSCILSSATDVATNDDFFLTSFAPTSMQLNEQLTKNETLNFSVGYINGRNLSTSVSFQYAKQLGLEGNSQNQTSFRTNAVMSYRLNSRSDIKLNWINTELERVSNNPSKDLQQQFDVSYVRELGKQTSLTTFVKHLDIDSRQRSYKVEEVQIGVVFKFTSKN